MIAALAPLVLLLGPSMGEPTAVTTVRGLLKKFGHAQELRLQQLQQIGADSGPQRWNVTLRDRSGAHYDAWLNADGTRVHELRKHRDAARSQGARESPSKDPAHLRRSWQLAKAVSGGRNLELTQIDVVGDRDVLATFSILVRGKRMLASWQRLGYTFVFDRASGGILAYSAREDVPEIESSVQRIRAEDAIRAASRVFEKEIAPNGKNVWGNVTHLKFLPDPVLGYYTPPGREMCRLVWLVRIQFQTQSPRRMRQFDVGVFIDAATGERLKSDYAL